MQIQSKQSRFYPIQVAYVLVLMSNPVVYPLKSANLTLYCKSCINHRNLDLLVLFDHGKGTKLVIGICRVVFLESRSDSPSNAPSNVTILFLVLCSAMFQIVFQCLHDFETKMRSEIAGVFFSSKNRLS